MTLCEWVMSARGCVHESRESVGVYESLVTVCSSNAGFTVWCSHTEWSSFVCSYNMVAALICAHVLFDGIVNIQIVIPIVHHCASGRMDRDTHVES